jgi:riboflavin synthase
MFSGIIAGTGTVKKLTRSDRSAQLTVEGKGVLKKLSPGESVAVNGVCLTVVSFSRSRFSADISDETLTRTTLGNLQVGDPINLEQAARFSDRIGGHLVSGHVDGVGRIKRIEPVENAYLFYIELPKILLKYCIEKGSIAVDGISLTINDLDKKGIFLMIIPHTMKMTNLGGKKRGDRVNIENDLVGKYVERFVKFK